MALHASACPLDCPDACGVRIETDAEGRFLRLEGNPDHSWSRGTLCGKTAIYHELARGEGRLAQPLVRKGGKLTPASWEEALERVVRGFAGLGPQLLALHYGGNMGLLQRHYPMRILNALGATATDGTICDATSAAGYELVLGRAVGPDLERVVEADCLLLWGCDARRTNQHLMPRIKELCSRGATVVVIDVYRSDTLRRIEGWGGRGLVLRPGTDAALALGLAEAAFQRGCADLDYLRQECVGAAELRAELAGRYPLPAVAEITGIDQGLLEWLVDRLAESKQTWFKVGIGWNRRRNGGMSMRAVCTLAAVLGAGDRLHFESGDFFALDENVIQRPDLRPRTAREPISQVALGKELEEGRFRAALVWGHNPAMTVPDSRRVRAGLARSDLFLVVHELVLTETARLADVVLPATAHGEHCDLYRSYGHRILQLGPKVCTPPAQQRSNVDLARALGEGLGLPRELWEKDEEALVAELLQANQARFSSAELARLHAGEPVKLAPLAEQERGTPSGRIELVSEVAEALGQGRVAHYVPDDGAGLTGRFWFHSAPSVATHNSTYGLSPRHRAREGEPRVRVHPDDADELGLGGWARVVNELGRLTLRVERSSDVSRGLVVVDGFPDPARVPEGLSTNALTPSLPADLGGGSAQYSARVDLEPIEDPLDPEPA